MPKKQISPSTKLISKKPNYVQIVVISLVVLLLVTGLVAALISVRRSQDIRQQATGGDTPCTLSFTAVAADAPTGTVAPTATINPDCPAGCDRADLNNSGAVDTADYSIFVQYYNQTCSE